MVASAMMLLVSGCLSVALPHDRPEMRMIVARSCPGMPPVALRVDAVALPSRGDAWRPLPILE